MHCGVASVLTRFMAVTNQLPGVREVCFIYIGLVIHVLTASNILFMYCVHSSHNKNIGHILYTNCYLNQQKSTVIHELTSIIPDDKE